MPTIIDGMTCYSGDELDQIIQDRIEKNIREMKKSDLILV